MSTIQEGVLTVLDDEDDGEGTSAVAVSAQVGVTVRQASAALYRMKKKGWVVNGYGGGWRCLWYRGVDA